MKKGKSQVTYKDIWLTFRDYAKKNGYENKVVGDEAFTNKSGKIIRLKSGKDGVIIVYEEDRGLHEIPLTKQ